MTVNTNTLLILNVETLYSSFHSFLKNAINVKETETEEENVRMWFLSLDMAATASSWERNSTSASPVDLPLGATSM